MKCILKKLKHCRNPIARRKTFSLIEVLIVMGILAPLTFSVIWLGPVSKERSRRQLRGDAEKLQEFLGIVERYSVSHDIDAEVWCSPMDRGGYLCQVRMQRSLPAKVWALFPKTLRLSSVTELFFSGNCHADAVVFEFNGALGGQSSGRVCLCNHKHSQSFCLSHGGGAYA